MDLAGKAPAPTVAPARRMRQARTPRPGTGDLDSPPRTCKVEPTPQPFRAPLVEAAVRDGSSGPVHPNGRPVLRLKLTSLEKAKLYGLLQELLDADQPTVFVRVLKRVAERKAYQVVKGKIEIEESLVWIRLAEILGDGERSLFNRQTR